MNLAAVKKIAITEIRTTVAKAMDLILLKIQPHTCEGFSSRL